MARASITGKADGVHSCFGVPVIISEIVPENMGAMIIADGEIVILDFRTNDEREKSIRAIQDGAP